MGAGRQIVIGLTGPFGAGCSTIAKDLKNRCKWRRYSLTEAMRELAPDFRENLDKNKLFSPKHRPYQQDTGDHGCVICRGRLISQ